MIKQNFNIYKKIQRYIKKGDFFKTIFYLTKYKIRFLFYRYFHSFIKRKIERRISKISFDKIKFSKFYKPEFGELVIDERHSRRILKKSDEYLDHYFNILGSGKVKLETINWYLDFKSGFEWKPGKFFKNYIQEDISNNADVKIPRELSRCHHFIILGEAYLSTGDDRYTTEFINQILDWIDQNPLMYSINWGCTMDVAIRAVNWIWAVAIFNESSLLTDTIRKKIIMSLYEHGWFIYRNPEKRNENNNNHYLADLAGQIHLGLLFQNNPEGEKWLTKGIKELYKEIRYQILPSGVSYERATNYNRLELELILIPVLILKKNNLEIPQDIWFRIEKMFEFIMHSLKPDGTTPIIGDQDDGRLLPFGLEVNIDYRYLLSIGSILYNRSDFKQFSDGYNIYCHFLLECDSLEKFKKIKNENDILGSRAFPDAGFYIMREKNTYMFINNSGKGFYPDRPSGGTHTHSDLLSFELFFEDKSFLIDPGSYIYTGNIDERLLFRSTKMHNTVVVDGFNQNKIRKEILWDFDRNAIPKVNNWELNDFFDYFEGEHSGYCRLKNPIIHRRSIFFDKIKDNFLITDNLIGVNRHLFEFYFHFDIGIDFDISENKVSTICQNGSNIIMIFESKKKTNLIKLEGWVSKAYGIKEKSKILVVKANTESPFELKTKISKKG